ncbi:MAG: hypothetical protein ACRDRZ_11460 [Pseudonocardiaceae bacterium]
MKLAVLTRDDRNQAGNLREVLMAAPHATLLTNGLCWSPTWRRSTPSWRRGLRTTGFSLPGPPVDKLRGVAGPDVDRLVRRVEEQDETVRPVSDTVLDIKDTVDQHTETLAAHSRELAAIRQTQAEHGGLLERHAELLTEILRRLDVR